MMPSRRGSVALLLVFAVACGDLPEDFTASDYAVVASGLNPPRCPDDQLDDDGNPVVPTCSGTAPVQSSCFVPLGSEDLRREIAQTFRVSQEGHPGIFRLWVRRLQDMPADPEAAASLHVGLYEIPEDQPEDFLPLDGRDSGLMIAEGFIVRSRLEDATRGYPLDVDVPAAIPLMADEEVYLYPEARYALIITVPEGEAMSFGIGCHEAAGGVDVYRDGHAFTRQQRKLSGTVEEGITYTQQVFVKDTRDLAFSFSLDDGCIAGQMVTCGIGACERTIDQCADGDFQECVPGLPSAELCDNIDNDCNGVTDDIVPWQDADGVTWPGLGRTTCGVGECTETVDNCINGEAIGTTYVCVPGAPTPEICDGRDNNCNGKTDEPEETGWNDAGVGVCRVIEPACQFGGPWTTDPDWSKASAVELCNGINDTCEGDIGDFDIDPATGQKVKQAYWPFPDQSKRNKGICRDGVQTCANDESPFGEFGELYLPQAPVWNVTTPPVGPGVETCNGRDDDCDGTIDNNIPPRGCYTGPPGTQNIGQCKGGQQTCVVGGTGAWGSCIGEVRPTLEICNGLDDDCNGQTDEGQPDIVCGTGVCQVTRGQCTGAGGLQNCAAQGYPQGDTTKKSPEICDGLDNDCDGTTDLDPLNPGNPLSKPCYTGPSATRNKGQCRDGTQTCAAGAFGLCAGQVVPTTEVCNNLDDNCDGQIDENPTTLCPHGPNATGTNCVVGVCHITSCAANTFDIDGNAGNGCECVVSDPVASTCGGAAKYTVMEGGSYAYDGRIPVANRADWIRVDFPPQAAQRQRNRGIPQIVLTQPPGGHYHMRVHVGGCTANNTCGTNNYLDSWAFRDNASVAGNNDYSSRGTNWPTTVYVEVLRKTSANICVAYKLNITRSTYP